MIVLRKRDIEWAKGFLEPGITTLFGYAIKRNMVFEIDLDVLDLAEVYAVMRQTASKSEIERLWKVKILVV